MPGPDSKPVASRAASAVPVAPDYGDGGLVALTRSLAAALGGARDDAVPPLAALPIAELAESRRVVLIVVDGLGASWLERVSPDGVLSAHRRATISSVFPPTTAAAITTLLTGATPATHGLTGWFVNLGRHRLVAAPLPFRERAGRSLELRGVRAADLYPAPPLSEAIRTPSWMVQPRALAGSVYTRHHARGARVVDYQEPEELLSAVLGVLRGRGPRYVYAYWSDLDATAHERGIGSTPARAALARFERAFEAFLERARGLDAKVVVTADHGFVDTTPASRLALADHAPLAACLAGPLTGEPRTVYCHLRRGAEDDFRACVRESLGGQCTAVPGAELIASGRLGPGRAHPQLADRIGDQVLVMHDRYVLTDRVAGERDRVQIGVHGGESADEMLVPLVVATL